MFWSSQLHVQTFLPTWDPTQYKTLTSQLLNMSPTSLHLSGWNLCHPGRLFEQWNASVFVPLQQPGSFPTCFIDVDLFHSTRGSVHRNTWSFLVLKEGRQVQSVNTGTSKVCRGERKQGRSVGLCHCVFSHYNPDMCGAWTGRKRV